MRNTTRVLAAHCCRVFDMLNTIPRVPEAQTFSGRFEARKKHSTRRGVLAEASETFARYFATFVYDENVDRANLIVRYISYFVCIHSPSYFHNLGKFNYARYKLFKTRLFECIIFN